MIEVTDEMVRAFIRAYSDADDCSSEVILSNTAEKAGLAAVLAIVERDQAPTQDAYDATVRALEKHRARADHAEVELSRLRAELVHFRNEWATEDDSTWLWLNRILDGEQGCVLHDVVTAPNAGGEVR